MNKATTTKSGALLTDAEVDHWLYEVGWWHGLSWTSVRELAAYIQSLRFKAAGSGDRGQDA